MPACANASATLATPLAVRRPMAWSCSVQSLTSLSGSVGQPGAQRMHLGVEGPQTPGVIGIGFRGQQPHRGRQGRQQAAVAATGAEADELGFQHDDAGTGLPLQDGDGRGQAGQAAADDDDVGMAGRIAGWQGGRGVPMLLPIAQSLRRRVHLPPLTATQARRQTWNLFGSAAAMSRPKAVSSKRAAKPMRAVPS